MNQLFRENAMDGEQSSQTDYDEKIDGLDEESWGDYPLDDILIRTESRTIFDVIRRIDDSGYIMDPDFQRDFIWDEWKQSKLIESVIMRIPLPVFYLAENQQGRMIVVDGLQRLSTFQRFIKNKLRLKLPIRTDLNGLYFRDLTPKLQNRVEDCNLTMYIVDSKAPARARLDIFERVNGGEPLTRQQMRNCLFMGKATQFLKNEAQTKIFLDATDGRLNTKTMRDREFVNRFCAFQILEIEDYNGDMDEFLAACLTKMNNRDESFLQQLSDQFRNSLAINFLLFERHAFRKFVTLDQPNRSVLNASLWDVMSTGLSRYSESHVQKFAEPVRNAVQELLEHEDFFTAISYSTNDSKRVKLRFRMSRKVLKDVLGDYSN